jgi:4'-phosphopantetheinyl transferase
MKDEVLDPAPGPPRAGLQTSTSSVGYPRFALGPNRKIPFFAPFKMQTHSGPASPRRHFFDACWAAKHNVVQNRRVSIDTFVQTLPAPPKEFAWAWALDRPASEPLNVQIVRELPIETIARPKEDELILWFGAPGPRGGPNLFNYLSEDERVRAARFRFEADRWAFAAAHAGLRALLGPIVRRGPQALRFAAGVNGKPFLDHTGRYAALQFSISHTRGCVAIAVAGCAVGIDVEQRREISDLMAVARTAFAPEGHAALAARSARPARTALFYRYWTLGEAFIKATGEGITQDLASFAFTEEGAPALTRVTAGWGPGERWRFYCEP